MRLRIRDQRGPETELQSDELDRALGLTGLGRVLELLKAPHRPPGVCPVCGWTAERYKATGLFGCGGCYEALGLPGPS